jgi:aldose sugar dehydrogenase
MLTGLTSRLALATLVACGNTGGVSESPATEPPSPQEVPHRVVTVVEGLEHPWGMAFLPDGGILVTERPGRLRIVRDGRLSEPVSGVPQVRAQGQGGLLDVALHPDFASNRLVYLTYSKPGAGGATTAVARGRLEGNALTGVQDVFVADAWASGGQHFGSRIAFDSQRYLYLTIGDRGDRDRAQNRGDHVGATIRLHDDGRVPADNPFVGDPNARDELFTWGNRNAQGMVVHPETGAVWQNEHGPRGGDEINLMLPGRNYGWPLATGGEEYRGGTIAVREHGGDLEPPLLEWTPSIAPSGMAYYGGDAFPQWRGDFFVGALAGQHLRRVRFEGTRFVEQESLLHDRGQRIRDVRVGPDGFIYLLVDASSAPVLRLEPAG